MSAQQEPERFPATNICSAPFVGIMGIARRIPKTLGDGEWGCLRQIRSTKSVSVPYLHSADFAVLLAMKQVISATGKLRISYGVRSLSAARQVRHMHIFRSFPAMKTSVRISGCFHGWPHQIPAAGRTQGFGMKWPARASVADEKSYLFRICSCRSGSDFSYKNNNFSYGESATQRISCHEIEPPHLQLHGRVVVARGRAEG